MQRTCFLDGGGRERWGGVCSHIDSDQFSQTFPLYVRSKRLFVSNTYPIENERSQLSTSRNFELDFC